LGKKFGRLNYPWGVTVNLDKDMNEEFIYVCDYKNSRCVRFTQNLQPHDIYALSSKEHKPRRVQVKENSVYILHKSEADIYITIFDKTTRTIQRSFKQNETNVKSFYVDDIFNVFTIGQVENEKVQSLCCYNKYNQLIFKTLLLVENKIWDFIIKQDDKEIIMYCACGEGLFIFEF
jgi:hypothetical protein